jgi:Bardet-Biedl syndrome 2 protein
LVVQALVIRAEDARLMNDMQTMRRAYTELNSLNGQLIAGYNVRAQNQANLLAALKEVNQMIQRAANLRMGKAKARVIADCRAAVKANNMKSLFRIIQQGFEPSNVPAAGAAQPKHRN